MPQTSPTPADIFVSKQYAFPHYEGRHGIAYRIEIDLTQPQRPMQRHVWIMSDGSENAQDWIASFRDTPENLLARGYTRQDAQHPAVTSITLSQLAKMAGH